MDKILDMLGDGLKKLEERAKIAQEKWEKIEELRKIVESNLDSCPDYLARLNSQLLILLVDQFRPVYVDSLNEEIQ